VVENSNCGVALIKPVDLVSLAKKKGSVNLNTDPWSEFSFLLHHI
jgi:hypothetical protein